MTPSKPTVLLVAMLLVVVVVLQISTANSLLQFEPRRPADATRYPPVAPAQQSITPLDTFVEAAKRWTAGAALAATLAVGTWTLSASAVEVSTKTIIVEVDAPVLLKRLRGEKYQTELLDALKELQDVVGPDAVRVTPPSNVKGAFRDLLSGKGEVTLNGQPVDVALLSSEKGEVTIRVSNPLLPKVPILSADRNVPFLSSRGGGAATTVTTTSEMVTPDIWDVLDTLWSVFGPDEDVTATTLLNLLGRAYGWDMETPFQDQKFFGGKFGIPIPRAEDKGGPFTYVPTNKDVAGGTSLGLGAIYAGAYAYHNALIEYEESLAEKKKKERADKAAARAAKEKSDAEGETKKAEEAAAKDTEERADAENVEAAKKFEEEKEAVEDAVPKEKVEGEAVVKIIDEPPQLVRVDKDEKTSGGTSRKKKEKRSRLLRLFRRGV